MKNKSNLAQFFTPDSVALLMADLSKNTGRFLEPSCGNGVLVQAYYGDHDFSRADFVAIEIDSTVAPEYARAMDFFQYPITEKFSTIISNPPYLSHKAIPESTRNLPVFKQLQAKLGGLANLYAAFILKSFLHLEHGGEMIFVVPEELFRTTSNFKLNDFLHRHGTFTDIIKFERTPFKEVSQEVFIHFSIRERLF